MTLIPIEHPRRLASPEDTARLFAGLGEKTVAVRGYHTDEPALIARLVAAPQPPRESTISFERSAQTSFSRDAQDALSALALSSYEYLDLRTANASLRIWPARYSWVHADAETNAAEAVLGRPLAPGKNQLGDAELTVDRANTGYPIFLETGSIPRALAFFRALTNDLFSRGFVMNVEEDAKLGLLGFLQALRPRADCSMELDLAGARALTESCAGAKADWQAGGVMVRFPDGEISGFLTTPNVGERHRDKWLARVDKGLRRAGLS